MNNTIKNTAYAAAGIALVSTNSIVNAINFGVDKVDPNLKGTDKDAVTVIQSWVAAITTLLAIIAVIVILWAGFQILTAAGDEEKTKKGKTIIIQAMIGLLVIFIANSIVNWIIGFLFSKT